MYAKFELEYNTGRDIDVVSKVIVDVKYDCDKSQFVQSVADMLGVGIIINESFAEGVFNDDNKDN
jgi:hypothetical protein